MPRATDSQSLIQVVVTPRFELFYALQALESGPNEKLYDWTSEMGRRIPARLRTSFADIAPCPLMWPLFADALREAPPAVTFPEMMEMLRKMDEQTFQTSVLEGAFKTSGAVRRLVDGDATLASTVASEVKSQQKLLSLLGLSPYSAESRSARAFQHLIDDPSAYRNGVVAVLESFWKSAFEEIWQRLDNTMRETTRTFRPRATLSRFPELARERKLPLTIEDDHVVNVRAGSRIPMGSIGGVYLIPTVFNSLNLWAAYPDAQGRTRYFLPLLDISPADRALDPALVFRALGDITRYAIASSIAREPTTSVELARAFSVSKPTISHHVQVLRSAGLLEETQTEAGVLLALNRRVLERTSAAAAREMFSEHGGEPVVKRSRRANRAKKK